MPAHAGAGSKGRLKTFQPSHHSADDAIVYDLPTLIARAESLTRNNPLISGAMITKSDAVVGHRLHVRSEPDWKMLRSRTGNSRFDEEWAKKFGEVVDAEWRYYSESGNSCATGRHSHLVQSRQVYNTRFSQSGQALLVGLYLDRPGHEWKTCWQTVEGDRLANPTGQMDTPTFRNGIETDIYGRPSRYHLLVKHPGDSTLTAVDRYKTEAIEAYTPWGRPRVLHFYRPDRIGQTLGKPDIAAVIETLFALGQYSRTELEAALNSASWIAKVQTPMPTETVDRLLNNAVVPGGHPLLAFDEMMDKRRENIDYDVAPGSTAVLLPGETMDVLQSNRPNQNYAAFNEHFIRLIGASLGMPYEMIMRDFTKSNQSSATAALMEAWRGFYFDRHLLVTQVWNKQLEAFVEELVGRGRLVEPEFWQHRNMFLRCKWLQADMEPVNTVDGATTERMQMQNGTATIASNLQKQGMTVDEFVLAKQREKKAFEDAGLVYPYNNLSLDEGMVGAQRQADAGTPKE